MKIRFIGLLIAIPVLAWLAPYIAGALFLLAITFYQAIETTRYPQNAKFQAAHWQADQKFRYNVLAEVNSNILKKGMTQAQVLKTLGNPDSKTVDGMWQYDVHQPGWRLIDWEGGGLLLVFDSKQKLKGNSINYWRD